MAHNFGNIKFQKIPPSPLPPPAKRKQDGPLGCVLPHTIGWKDYYYYFGTQMDQFHCKKKRENTQRNQDKRETLNLNLRR